VNAEPNNEHMPAEAAGLHAHSAGSRPEPSPVAAFSDLGTGMAEAGQHAADFVHATIAVLRFQIRRLVLAAILGVIAFTAIVVLLGKVVVLFVSGMAGGLGELLGDRAWLGNLLTAVLILAAAALAVRIAAMRLYAAWLQQSVQGYEHRKSRRHRRSR